MKLQVHDSSFESPSAKAYCNRGLSEYVERACSSVTLDWPMATLAMAILGSQPPVKNGQEQHTV